MSNDVDTVLYFDFAGIGRIRTANGKISPGGRVKSMVEDDAGDAGKSTKRRGARASMDVLLFEDINTDALIGYEGTITAFCDSGRTFVMRDAWCSTEGPEIAEGKLSLEYSSITKAETVNRA